MSEVLILPYFNRYSAGTVSQSPSGIFAYASRSDIFIIDVLGNRALTLDSKSIQLAHKGRITRVSFCKKDDVELLASVGDEGIIKVWDLETKICVKETKAFGTVAEWAYKNSDVLFFQSDAKHLVKWFLSTDTVRKIKTDSEMLITILASNETNLLAAGHQNGAITIFDVIHENILQKLKAHSQEISSLSWNPISPEMLLTSSYDLSLRLWKIGEDKPVNSYYVPVGRVRYEDKKKVNIVGTWHPRNHDMAICSNFRCEWGEVCLSKGETPKFSTFLSNIDLTAKGLIFCFTFAKKTAQGIQDLLIIFDLYKLTVWNFCKKKLELQIPIVMGFVYGLSFSSINPNLLAIGTGDGVMKILNVQVESAEQYVMKIFVHSKARIMTAAWHPLYENIIAYGTDEGRVAIIDLFKKKSVYTFETYHSDKVYTVCWGPFKPGKSNDGKGPSEDEFCIYSCGSSTIYINRLNYSRNSAYNFDDFASLPPHMESTEKTYSEVIWKPDFSYMLIGSYKGFIDLYNDELAFLNRYNVEMRTIECLTWHPERTYESPNKSPLEFWFAASGNDTDICLFNSTKTCVEQSQGEDNSKWESKKLVGHKKRVVRICWSQHNDGFLASSSRDGSVIVWNACTGVILATYLLHQDNVLAVQWSVTDPDVIYSGGEDNSVRKWKISEQTAINPLNKGPPRRKGKKWPNKNNAKQLIGKAEISLEAENREPLKSRMLVDAGGDYPNDENDDEIFPFVETGDTNSEGLPISEKKPLTETDRKQLKAQGLSRKGVPQLFPFHSLNSDTSKENDLKDCLQLADVLRKKKNVPFDETQMFDFSKHSMNIADEDILKLGPFMDQMTALKMLEVQAENFKPKETFRHFCHLSVMSSNVKALIDYAAANKKLSNFHVSLAPCVSSSYWFEICEKYAKQLLEAHQYNQACMYLLICNKVNEAIDIWADKIDVIEALILAKARLPESDPKIRSLLFRARKRYISHNNHARVAKCYLALDQPFTAAKTLFNVSDPKFMKAGIHIAKLYEVDDIAKKYVYLYMVKCLSLDDWNALTELVNEEPSMKVYSSLFAVHKAFKIHLQYLGKTENLEEEILFQPDSSKPLKFWIGSTCMESKESFVKYVYRILLLNNLLPSETDEILDILKVLGNMFTKKETYDCEIQADILISLCITQFIFYCILEDRTAANFYFLKIFESSFNETFLLEAVCSLFIPLSLSWNCNTHSIICESRTDNNEESDADAVMCHFHNINQAIAEEIMSFRLDYIISKFYSQDNCPLSPLHENVVDVLKRKPVNEYALAYFIANLAQNLMRLVEKREMICYAEKTCFPELQKEDTKPIIPSKKLEDGLLIQTSSVHDLKTEDESNKKMVAINSEEEKEIKNLIEIVLEEAEAKAKLLSKSKANSTPGNVVDYDASMQESKILEDNSLCISQEKKSCVDINDENSSKIVTWTNATNDAELPKKLMNDERNEKECSVISSNDEILAISKCIDLKKKTDDEEKSSNIISGTDRINDAEFPKNLVIEENNEKECFMISSSDENLEISQCIDLEKKSCADINEEESSKIITGTNDAELPKKLINEGRNEKECLRISSNDENLAISQCIDLEKKTVDKEKSSNIISGTERINDAELPKNPVIEENNEKKCFMISSSDENLEISQCIDLEKKSCAVINEEESSKIITGTNDAELPKKLINEGRNEKECLRISSSDENSHVQCLAMSNLFLNVALFMISSISKQEFSYAHYSSESACIKKSELLKDTKKKIESYDELNGKMDEIISSETEESHSSGSFEIIENGEIANMMLKIYEKEKNDKKQIELSKINDNVNGIPSAKSNNMEINNFDKILTEPSTNNSETDEVQTSVPNESNMECDKNILNAENTGCNLVVIDSHYNSDSSEMGLSSLSESCANSFQIISPFGEDILKELKVIEGKIHVLIKESQPSLLSYPVPFEMLQNVFQVTYSMWKKSECSAVREELHKFMEQIKQYGKMEFGCEICFSK